MAASPKSMAPLRLLSETGQQLSAPSARRGGARRCPGRAKEVDLQGGDLDGPRRGVDLEAPLPGPGNETGGNGHPPPVSEDLERGPVGKDPKLDPACGRLEVCGGPEAGDLLLPGRIVDRLAVNPEPEPGSLAGLDRDS